MRRLPLTAAFLTLIVAATACRASFAAAGDVTLTGSFVWEKRGQPDPITAVFTPNGDKKWTVVYSFKWGGAAQNWKGSAEGDLKNGAVTGEGLHPNGKRKFTFTATAKNGTIEGTHMETTGGKDQATGTITLKP